MPYEWDEKRLEDEFMRFGEILSVSVSMGKRKPVPPGKRIGAAAAAAAEKKDGEEKEGENGAEDVKVSVLFRSVLIFALFFPFVCTIFGVAR